MQAPLARVLARYDKKTTPFFTRSISLLLEKQTNKKQHKNKLTQHNNIKQNKTLLLSSFTELIMESHLFFNYFFHAEDYVEQKRLTSSIPDVDQSDTMTDDERRLVQEADHIGVRLQYSAAGMTHCIINICWNSII